MRVHDFHVQIGFSAQQHRPQQFRPQDLYWDPVLGQWVQSLYPLGGYYALWFIAKEEYEAANVWPEEAPKEILYGDTIRVHYSFRYKGPADSVVLKVGNCKLVGPSTYDVGSSETKTITLAEDLTAQTYSGYVDFIFGEPLVFDNKHLFVLLDGEGYEVVYKNAFTGVAGVFTDLEITSFAKV